MKKKFNVLFALSILCYVLLLGCNDSDAANNETVTTEVESEAVSEVVEEISEEENGPETSEENSLKTVEEIEYANCTNGDEFIEYLKQYDGVIITNYSFAEEGRPQVLIPNGAYYTISEGESIRIIPNNKEVTDVQNSTYNFELDLTMVGWAIRFWDKGEDQETSFVVNYADGTSEEFTLYITVE
ncbi:MAG: hypothetical protein E7284_00465 [Lachnospiraceae bacterium]|nr:hypothetical protein [Lachnospiraceae bacterium]